MSRALADRAGAWEAIRERSVERLNAHNLSARAFEVVSRYLIVDAVKRS